MAVNKRLIFWLVKAYIKKWRRTIGLSFLIGLACFFLLRFVVFSLLSKIPVIEREIIGSVGAYTVEDLPSFVLSDLSRGLVNIDKNGKIIPDLASSWEIQDKGKAYIFHLKKDVHFVDGTSLTSKEVMFSFSDVVMQRPNDETIVFRLKNTYTPFLVTLSRPIFKKGFVGIGEYKIKDIKLNGPFVTSLITVNVDDALRIKQYQFYPTQESLKIAFVLGNITKAVGLTDLSFQDASFLHFPNAAVKKEIDYSQLVTLFYNTQDKNLSDKKLRDALSYALPHTFSLGERAKSPIEPFSWAYRSESFHDEDFEHAQLLLQDVRGNDKNAIPPLTISTLPQYKMLTPLIAKSWEKIGIKTKVKIVTVPPNQYDTYEIFLGKFNVPKDPDQYSLWHSDQDNNITRYKSLRIDKLLEDGRNSLNQDERVEIYAEFQKYLADDQPASFLYFPYVYTVRRK